MLKSIPATLLSSLFRPRSSESSTMTVYSETALQLYAGTFAQRRPYLAMADRSMWSKPVPRVRTYFTPTSRREREISPSMWLAPFIATASEPLADSTLSGNEGGRVSIELYPARERLGAQGLLLVLPCCSKP